MDESRTGWGELSLPPAPPRLPALSPRAWRGARVRFSRRATPAMFVQAKAGHAQGSTTERYLHAHRTSYPDAAELAEARLFTTT